MKEYSALPLRSDEEVIEEFGVSNKYTYLLIGAGLITLILGILAYLSRAGFEESLTGGAGVLSPLLASALWIGLLILGLYIGGVGLYLELAYKYFLTNQRVIQTVGLFARRSGTSDYDQINDIVVRQDFINRLFLGTGTIGISTPGTAQEEYQLINVDTPSRRAELIRDLIHFTTNDRPVDKYLVAHLMVKNSLCATEQEALDRLDASVGKDPASEATFGAISPAFQEHLAQFHGGGDLEAPSTEPTAVTTSTPAVTEFAPGDTPGVSDRQAYTPGVSDVDAQEPSATVAPVVPQTAPIVQAPPAPVPTQPSAEPTPVQTAPVVPTPVVLDATPSALSPAVDAPALVDDSDVEDLLGDGIDESDRLRAAQKRLQNNQQP